MSETSFKYFRAWTYGTWNSSGNLKFQDLSVAWAGVSNDSIVGWSWDFNIPTNATIVGVQAIVDGAYVGTINTPKFKIRISSNGGSTWSAWKYTGILPAYPSPLETFYLGGETDLWNRTLTPELINDDTNFRIEIQSYSKFALYPAYWFCDVLNVKVFYTIPDSEGVKSTHFVGGGGGDNVPVKDGDLSYLKKLAPVGLMAFANRKKFNQAIQDFGFSGSDANFKRRKWTRKYTNLANVENVMQSLSLGNNEMFYYYVKRIIYRNKYYSYVRFVVVNIKELDSIFRSLFTFNYVDKGDNIQEIRVWTYSDVADIPFEAEVLAEKLKEGLKKSAKPHLKIEKKLGGFFEFSSDIIDKMIPEMSGIEDNELVGKDLYDGSPKKEWQGAFVKFDQMVYKFKNHKDKWVQR